MITGYNLIDIRNEEEAIKEGTAVARMSVIERKNDTENIIEVVKRMSKHIRDKEERQEFAKEIKYLLSDKLTKEEIEKIENILIEKEGEDAMLHAQMVIRRDFEKAKEEGRREGMLHAQVSRLFSACLPGESPRGGLLSEGGAFHCFGRHGRGDRRAGFCNDMGMTGMLSGAGKIYAV